jgi:hypothetical protein
MKVEPYVPFSTRIKSEWNEVSSFLGLPPVVIRKAYMDRWCRGVSRRQFFDLVKRGEIAKAEFDKVEMTQAEMDKEQAEWEESMRENDFCDLISYRLKQLIEVGDEVVADETKTYCFSQLQYQTKGKRYKITVLNDEPGSEFGYQTETDLEGERNWGSHLGCRSLWRDGKEIWNWNRAYLELWKEQNPGHPQTAEMEEYSREHAQKASVGER